MTEYVVYETIAEGKGKLRLYMNDPEIMKHLRVSMDMPIEIEGKMVIGKTKDGKIHWFFTHENPSFIPVFFDLESSKVFGPKSSVYGDKENGKTKEVNK